MSSAAATKQIDIDLCFRAAKGISPATINKEKGSVEAVWATDTPVRTYNYDIGEFWEVLGFEPGMVRTQRLTVGIPILKEHRRYEDDLGTGINGRVEGNSLIGTLEFDINDKGEGEKAFGKVERGHLKTTSIGYRVYTLKYMGDGERGLPIYMATDWEPMEISTARIPADINAKMRTTGEQDATNKLTIEKQVMEKTPLELEAEKRTAELAIQKRIDDAKIESSDAGIKSERTRVATMLKIGTEHKMEDTFVREHIAKDTTLDAFRALVLDKKSEAQPTPNGKVIEKFTDAGQRNLAMVEGIVSRIDRNRADDKKILAKPEIKENPYAGVRLIDICDEFYQRMGGDMSLSPMQRVAMAIKMSSREVGMSTSDLPNLFANVLHKILRKEYNFQTGKWQPFCYNQPGKRINQNEISIKLGDFTAMGQLAEGKEFPFQAIDDEAENFIVHKFGSSFAITIEMIINDDLDGMERIGMKAAKANAFTEDVLVWALLQSNPKMADGNNVFSSAHNNIDTGAAISTTTINNLWKMITTQKASNKQPLDIEPKYIITGRNNQMALDQILNPNLMPITPTDAVQSYIKLLTPIYTNRIPDNRFYLVADPANIDTIRFGGVSGEPDFSMENYWEPGRDAWVYKMRKFFGAAFTDFRGMAFNPGV